MLCCYQQGLPAQSWGSAGLRLCLWHQAQCFKIKFVPTPELPTQSAFIPCVLQLVHRARPTPFFLPWLQRLILTWPQYGHRLEVFLGLTLLVTIPRCNPLYRVYLTIRPLTQWLNLLFSQRDLLPFWGLRFPRCSNTITLAPWCTAKSVICLDTRWAISLLRLLTLFHKSLAKRSPSGITLVFCCRLTIFSKSLFLRWLSFLPLMNLTHPGLKEQLWGGHLWNPSYYVGTVGQISEETVKKYIDAQKTRQVILYKSSLTSLATSPLSMGFRYFVHQTI